MNALIPASSPNWSARALAVRPVAATLRTPPKPAIAPLHDPKHLKPVAHVAPFAPFALAHEPIIEDDCAHWFQDERHVEQPFVELPMLISDTTEWSAFSLYEPGRVRYMALMDSLSPEYVFGKLNAFGEVFANNPDYPAEPPATSFVPNTAPLVAAAKKEAEMLVKIHIPECPGVTPLIVEVKDESEHALVMQAYRDRIAGLPGAVARWNAISAGKCRNLSVAESLARFGHKDAVTA